MSDTKDAKNEEKAKDEKEKKAVAASPASVKALSIAKDARVPLRIVVYNFTASAHWFKDMAKSMEAMLAEAASITGGVWEVKYAERAPSASEIDGTDVLWIVFGAHDAGVPFRWADDRDVKLGARLPNYIIVNYEQASSGKLNNAVYLERMRHARAVWDYSETNRAHLSTRKLKLPIVRLLPFGFHACLLQDATQVAAATERASNDTDSKSAAPPAIEASAYPLGTKVFTKPTAIEAAAGATKQEEEESKGVEDVEPENPVDVLLYATNCARRATIVERLRTEGKLEVKWLQNCHGAELNAHRVNARVILNAHFYARPALELSRIVPAVAAGCCVVSEPSDDVRIDDLYRNVVAFAPTTHLTRACVELTTAPGADARRAKASARALHTLRLRLSQLGLFVRSGAVTDLLKWTHAQMKPVGACAESVPDLGASTETETPSAKATTATLGHLEKLEDSSKLGQGMTRATAVSVDQLGEDLSLIADAYINRDPLPDKTDVGVDWALSAARAAPESLERDFSTLVALWRDELFFGDDSRAAHMAATERPEPESSGDASHPSHRPEHDIFVFLSRSDAPTSTRYRSRALVGVHNLFCATRAIEENELHVQRLARSPLPEPSRTLSSDPREAPLKHSAGTDTDENSDEDSLEDDSEGEGEGDDNDADEDSGDDAKGVREGRHAEEMSKSASEQDAEEERAWAVSSARILLVSDDEKWALGQCRELRVALGAGRLSTVSPLDTRRALRAMASCRVGGVGSHASLSMWGGILCLKRNTAPTRIVFCPSTEDTQDRELRNHLRTLDA